MRSIAPFALLVLVVLPSLALGGKTDDHVGAHPAWQPRQGGEDIAGAVEVPLPFSDTGATCGYVDDYDEICPYDNSTSPDVVYTFIPAGAGHYDVDLIGSSYDTKVYIYDQDLNLVACNDDFHPDYTSRIENLPLDAGRRYYLVIDGYGGDCGEYSVEICENPPCASPHCPDVAMIEGEPELVDGYVDTFNGGCDAAEPVFQVLYPPAGSSELVFCGHTGWFETGGVTHRDSDWLQLEAAGQEINVAAEGPLFLQTSCDVMFLQDCQDVSVLPYQMGLCADGDIDIPTVPGQTVYLRVRPVAEERTPCAETHEFYRLRISGLASVVAVEPVTWSAVKQLYR